MKKVNKILMATVSILLCLVLITTSVVSGVFARFAIKDTATSTVVFEKYGAKVSVNLDGLIKDSQGNIIDGIEVTEIVNGNTKLITVTGLKIGPGDMVPNAMRFCLSADGKKPYLHEGLNVQARLRFDLDYNIENFKVTNVKNSETGKDLFPNNSLISSNQTKYFMPIGYTLGHNSTKDSGYIKVFDPWSYSGTTSVNLTPTEVNKKIASSIKNNISAPTNGFVSSNEVVVGKYAGDSTTKIADPQITIKGLSTTPTNTFDFGYIWPVGESADKDVISSYMANHMPDDATFTLKVTLLLETAT